MRRLSLILVCACASAYADPSPQPLQPLPFKLAAPEPRPPVAWSFAAGLATGLVTLAVGGALLGSDARDDRIAGSYVVMSGLTLAPVVSHLVSREWGRAGVFGGLPALGLIGMGWLLAEHPQVVDEGNKDDTRVAYVVILAWGVVSCAGGLVDSLWAGERWRNRTNLALAPMVAPGRYGLSLGGDW
jgi:hypothetical protein